MSTTVFLNDDVILEVLSWLPAKEIVGLRCVCKRWLFLISEPGFIKCHSTRNPHPRIYGFFLSESIHNAECFPLNANSPHVLPDPSLSFIPVLDNRAQIGIEASSNGLIICSSRVFWRPIGEALYYICNPTTREFVRLDVPQEVDRCFCLDFNPSKSPNYKIVSMGSQIHVYSSETRAWKLSINNESLQELEIGRIFHHKSVYWNGAVIGKGRRCIVSFDIEKERVKKLPMPSRAVQSWRVVCIGESGGKLQMIWEPIRKRQVFYISEMDSEGSWSPLSYRVDLELIMDLYPNEKIYLRRRRSINPIHFLRGGEEGGGEDGLLLLNVRGRILSYSLANKVFTQVCDLSSPRGHFDFYSFGHTLFSP